MGFHLRPQAKISLSSLATPIRSGSLSERIESIRKLLLLPEVVELIASTLEPHHLAYYAQELATVFHGFYTQCRVVSRQDEVLSKARLKLVAAAKLVLARTLHLMGMTAPEMM